VPPALSVALTVTVTFCFVQAPAAYGLSSSFLSVASAVGAVESAGLTVWARAPEVLVMKFPSPP
jgi:hypothetical protein